MKFNSLPTVEQLNIKKYWDIIRQLEPEFFLIRLALEESGVNPMVIPKIIRQIGNIAIGTGYGKVQVFVQQKMVTQVKGEESDQVNEEAIIDK